ncbi:MAG: immunoglobulin domain-containing protein, partial [Bacteroidota bacterium]
QWFFAKDKPFDRHHNGLQDVFLSLYTTGGSRENTGYFGGEKNEYLTDAIVASNGDLYITGYTESEVSSSELTSESTLFPVTLNAYQIQHAGGLDGFFAKVKRDGTVLIGSTYIGGSGDDKLFALDYHPVTSSIITTGTTTSSDFPIKNNFGESKKSGISDVIIIDISELANSINYSTYIGGKGEDTGYDIASDRKYAYVVAGSTDSKNFDHVQGSFQEDHNGGLDGIIFKNSYSQLSMNIPYPGNSYCRGRVLFFDWNAQGFSQGTVFSLEGSPDDGESWFIIDEEIEDYNYSWMIPDEQPLSDEYRFRVVHESGQYSEINGNIAIDGAPEIDSITINNNSAVFCPGDELMLMVFARGKNLEYQWKKNGNLIENVNSDTLKIESLSESDAGNYEAIIKGACPPDIISDTYQINVLPPVKITRSPADTTVSAGNPIEFHVSARGVNLSYQWQKNGNNIIGATDSTFAIESVADQNDGSYRCIVSGDCNSDTSLAAVLIVEPVTGIQNSNGPLDNSSLKMNVNEAGGNTIDLDIYSGSAGKIKISLYSITGRQISVLYNDEIQSGLNKLMLNTDRLASGVWLLVGTIGDKTTAARLNYIR